MIKKTVTLEKLKNIIFVFLSFFWFPACILGMKVANAQSQVNPSASPSTRGVGTTRDELQTKLKFFIAPEAGLNNEIRAALIRIEQACDLSKAKLKDPLPLSSKNVQMIKEIAGTRDLIARQQTELDKAMSTFRLERGLNNKICATAIDFLPLSDQCTRFRSDSATLRSVSSTADFYYTEALARFTNYETAIELERVGCTRLDFGAKLWAAEQLHILPKLRTSADQLTNFLK
jgi:hypothetical protein